MGSQRNGGRGAAAERTGPLPPAQAERPRSARAGVRRGYHAAVPATPDDWRTLKVGDRVRIVRMPTGVDEPGYTFHPDSRRLYERLIDRCRRGRSLRVFEICEHGLPWVQHRYRDEDGVRHHEWLALNDDSWVRVKPRAKPPHAPARHSVTSTAKPGSRTEGAASPSSYAASR